MEVGAGIQRSEVRVAALGVVASPELSDELSGQAALAGAGKQDNGGGEDV